MQKPPRPGVLSNRENGRSIMEGLHSNAETRVSH